MKIYDCFMFFDEELILDVRLNVLNEFVDYFVIVESKYDHKGNKRKLVFNIENYKEFENKIIYLVHKDLPNNIKKVNKRDSKNTIGLKSFHNAAERENAQRNFISYGLEEADNEDIILISDVDEIPNLDSVNFDKKKSKITVFEQKFFNYKFDLYVPNFTWFGTKAIKKKNLESPQWARNIKCKKYPKYRIDILFSKKKYNSIDFIKDGGWHFSNIKSPEEIEIKYKSFLHHYEFEQSLFNLNKIKNLMQNKRAIYDFTVDKKNENKIGNGENLEKYDNSYLPKFLIKNKKKFKDWFDKN